MDIADIKLAMELFGSNGGKVSVIHLRGHEYPSAGRGFIERTMRDLATRQKTARIGALLSKRQESGNSHKGLFRATWEYRHSFPIEIYTPFGNWASRSFRKYSSVVSSNEWRKESKRPYFIIL
jgi:hypothetical protein